MRLRGLKQDAGVVEPLHLIIELVRVVDRSSAFIRRVGSFLASMRIGHCRPRWSNNP